MTFGMETDTKLPYTIPSKEIILRVLEEEDPESILLRPDKYSYTTALFMQKLFMPDDKLKDLLEYFLFHLKVKMQNQVYLEGDEGKGFLPEKQLLESIWILKKCTCISTGANLDTQIMNDFEKDTLDCFCLLIQQTKDIVAQKLKSLEKQALPDCKKT